MHEAINHEQFIRLFLRNERELFRTVSVLVPFPDDAQEVLQETAVALWRKIDAYDPARPFAAWARRFAILEARQYMKRSRRWRAFLDEELAKQLLARSVQLTDALDERREHLANCQRKLPKWQRWLVERYYYDRQTIEDLSAEAGRSVEALYKALQRIRRALFDCINRSLVAAGGRGA